MADVVELKDLSELREPVLIAAFTAQRRGGRIATRALTHLVDNWQAECVARIESQAFTDFAVRRPQTRRRRDRSVIEWPDTSFYLARPEGANRDFVLLVGPEPNFRWREFAETVASYADRAGVKTLVGLRGMPGQVPHTRPAPVYLNASDVEFELQFGVQQRERRYEGPTDIGSVIAAQVQSLRWQTVELSVIQPDYFPRMPNAEANLALIRVLDRAFGTKTPIGPLEETARTQRASIDESISEDEGTKAAILEREQTYDSQLEKLDFLAAGGAQSMSLPSGAEVIEEVERLFREGEALPDADSEPE